jgi:hypothetical protein
VLNSTAVYLDRAHEYLIHFTLKLNIHV